MAEWPLVGRGQELARLRSLATDLTSHGVVLAAPAGVGKSRLAAEALLAAERSGMVTLVATGSPAVARVPLGAMASALSAFGGARGHTASDPGSLVHDVVQHIVDGAGNGRVFVVVDDAHCLDQASAAVVRHLAERPEAFLLVTLRTREQAPDAVTTLWKDGVLERIDLPELTEGAVEQLLNGVLGGPIDGGTLATITSRSQGNLLFLREIVIAARNDGNLRFEHGLWRLVGDSSPSQLLVELVEARLRRCTPEERRLLELLALGEPLGSHEVETISSIDVAERLEDVGLITSSNDGLRLQVRLAHPVYGEVLRSRLSGLHSRRLARALAEAVEATGLRRRDDALRVAVWRLAAGGGRPENFLAAAISARWRHDVALAHRLASAAVAAGAGFDAELLTAQLLLRLGQPDAADAMFARLCAVPEEDPRVRATLARVDIGHARFRPEEMLRELATLEPPPEDPGLRAAIAARQCVVKLITEGPRAALEVATPEFDPAHGDTVFALHTARAACFVRMGKCATASDELARVSTAIADSARFGWWRIPHTSVVSQHLVQCGQLQGTIDQLQEEYGRAVAIGSAETQMIVASTLGRRQADAGRIRTALRYLHEAVAIAEQFDYGLAIYEALRVVAFAEALAQRPDEAQAALERVEAARRTPAYSRGLAGEAAAWIDVARGELGSARQHFQETARFCRDVGDLVYAGSALHGLVRIGYAEDALDELAQLSTEVEGPWPALYLQHARGLVDNDAQHLEACARGFERMGAVLLAAEAAAHAEKVLRQIGNPRAATAMANLAADLAGRCEGARTPALEGLGARAALSDLEIETARYAAAGYSNKLIASRLQLSVRTVETRLQNAYLKLGISHREDLAAAILHIAEVEPTDGARGSIAPPPSRLAGS